MKCVKNKIIITTNENIDKLNLKKGVIHFIGKKLELLFHLITLIKKKKKNVITSRLLI